MITLIIMRNDVQSSVLIIILHHEYFIGSQVLSDRFFIVF